MEFKTDLLNGLMGEPKMIPPKYLYDETGSQLFEKICGLEEYYPTRTENKILTKYAPEISQYLGKKYSSSNPEVGLQKKIRILAHHLTSLAGYVPMEISKEILNLSTAELQKEFPRLAIFPIWNDYTDNFVIPSHLESWAKKRIVFFPGSTIGNFTPHEARSFIGEVHALVKVKGGLLIGVDLKKDPKILKKAYDDSRGITARFNFNLLRRANREAGTTFDVFSFRYQAFCNQRAGRVEMHLVSTRPQKVKLDRHEINFREGESICTEYSYKYSPLQFISLVEKAVKKNGFKLKKYWTDPKKFFGVFYFET